MRFLETTLALHCSYKDKGFWEIIRRTPYFTLKWATSKAYRMKSIESLTERAILRPVS